MVKKKRVKNIKKRVFKKKVSKKKVNKSKSAKKSKVVKINKPSMKIKVVNKSDRRPRLKPRPLSKEFLFTGVFGLVIVAWWTYFGFEGKPLDLAWGMSFMIIFLIMIIASFRSVEIS